MWAQGWGARGQGMMPTRPGGGGTCILENMTCHRTAQPPRRRLQGQGHRDNAFSGGLWHAYLEQS